MTTQVATTTSTIRAPRAQLRVPKRPPMNHVAIAIQKFIPYVVVFLLSLMLYSRLTAKTDYPPYSPPNKLDDTFAKDILNNRVERLEELKKLGETNSDVKVAPYNVWNNNKASELKRKLSGADMMDTDAARVVSELKGKVMGGLKDQVMDTAGSVTSYGTEATSNTQEFAYDEIYAWKQKAGVLNDSTKDKLKVIKEEVVEAGKEKVEGVIEKASEGLQSVSHDAWHAIEQVAEVFDFAGSAFGFASQAAYDHQRRIGRLRGIENINLPYATTHNGTMNFESGRAMGTCFESTICPMM